jgi:energy-coupling factor transporter ATP-binding protein EcfA2
VESHGADSSRPGAGSRSPVSGAGPNRAPAAFDVFISYNSIDRPLVIRVVRDLKRKNLDPWFDQWNLTPGGEWQEEMAAGLLQSSACAVFIGPGDLGAWTRLEMSVALNRAATDREFRLFPVLLPGLEPFEPANLPPFLATRTWVDLREGPESERRLQDLINAVNGVPYGADVRPEQEEGPAPYQGLEPFDEGHARYYFGREAYVQRLVEKLKGSRFIAVVGPSGSGKSSLVRAGLLPRLRAGGTAGVSWRISVLRPGAHPLAALAGQLRRLDSSLTLQSTVDQLAADQRTLHLITSAALADEPYNQHVLVVVDQGEELFTLCQDTAARTGFLNALHYASAVPDGRTAVVLTLRADFYARLAEFPQLAQLAQSHQLLIGGLNEEESRQVIEEPARVAGLEIERGLVETVLADVVREPGALPLLEHALQGTRPDARGLPGERWRAARPGGESRGALRRPDAGGAERGAAAPPTPDPTGRGHRGHPSADESS